MSRADSAGVKVGRYVLHREIASGGMASVHVGRRVDGGRETVAIKRMHAHFAKDADFIAMFLDEARIAARIVHPNVVRQLDFLAVDGELLLVMEYIEGESLARLVRIAAEPIPPAIAVAIVLGALRGLEAAHDAKNERGDPMKVVHRDVSPQNVLVGVDGVARVLDFGVAKATGRLQATTRHGELKGKVPYMAPEQLTGAPVDARSDVYACGVLLWEALTGKRLFDGDNDGAVLAKVLAGATRPPRELVPTIPPALDDFVMRAIATDPEDRFPTAADAARSLELALTPAKTEDVGRWVSSVARASLEERAKWAASPPPTVDLPPAIASSTEVTGAARASRTTNATVAMVVGGAVVIAALFVFRWDRRNAAATEPAPRGDPTAARSIESGARSGSAATAPAAGTGTAGPSTLASASTDPPPASSASVASASPFETARPSPRARVVAPKPATSAPARRAGCEKPYLVDSNGAMHVRRECL